MDLLLTAFFLFFAAGKLALNSGLSLRQMRYVQAHRDAVPSAFSTAVTADSHRKAADYTVAKERLALLELGWSLVLLLGWTLLGGLDWLNQTALHWASGLVQFGSAKSETPPAAALLGPSSVYQFLLLALVFACSELLQLPFAYYRQMVLEQRFGFNRSTLAAWLLDQAKAFVLILLFCLGFLTLVLEFLVPLQAQSSWWWIQLWLGFVALQLFLSWAVPRYGLRLFNRLDPMADGPLKSRIETLMHKAGFPVSGLFVMDGSRRSNHANAFFTGIGRHKRIVFYDTLLSKLTDDEVLAVLAHELGHSAHKHVLLRLLWLGASSLVLIGIFAFVLNRPWFYQGLGVSPNIGAPNHALALILLVFCMPVFGFLVGPLFSHLARKWEFEADAYAVTHSSKTCLASALLKLSENNASTLTPDPWYARVHYSHPPAQERLAKLGVF